MDVSITKTENGYHVMDNDNPDAEGNCFESATSLMTHLKDSCLPKEISNVVRIKDI